MQDDCLILSLFEQSQLNEIVFSGPFLVSRAGDEEWT